MTNTKEDDNNILETERRVKRSMLEMFKSQIDALADQFLMDTVETDKLANNYRNDRFFDALEKYSDALRRVSERIKKRLDADYYRVNR